MSELKPCPFCGASPKYKIEGLGGKLTVWIKCQQCRQSSVCSDWYGGDLGTMEAAWNTRSTPALTLARDALVDVKAAYAAQVAASVDQLKELRALKMGAMTGCAGVAERLEIERQFKHMEYHLIKIDAALSAINAELKE